MFEEIECEVKPRMLKKLIESVDVDTDGDIDILTLLTYIKCNNVSKVFA